MPVPERPKPAHAKDFLDKTIDNTLKDIGEDGITQSELNRVTVAAQVQEGIDNYRKKASGMSQLALETEEHNSTRLGLHLEATCGPRPQRCHAHAIVAGKHYLAATLRLAMSYLKIRIDDPDNGCWLPVNTAATPHPSFPAAPPHSRIHRFNYYFWITTHLDDIDEVKVFRFNLRRISQQLHEGTFPRYVMLPKGIGLPE